MYRVVKDPPTSRSAQMSQFSLPTGLVDFAGFQPSSANFMVSAGSSPSPSASTTFSIRLPSVASPRLSQFGLEGRGIGDAEVVQFHSSGHQVVLVNSVALGECREGNGGAGLLVLVNAARWLSLSRA